MTAIASAAALGFAAGIIAGFCLLAAVLAFAGGCLGTIINKSPER